MVGWELCNEVSKGTRGRRRSQRTLANQKNLKRSQPVVIRGVQEVEDDHVEQKLSGGRLYEAWAKRERRIEQGFEGEDDLVVLGEACKVVSNGATETADPGEQRLTKTET